MNRLLPLILMSAAWLHPASAGAAWAPAQGEIMTRWAAEVDSDVPLPEYPRPQMVREQWLNLNGLWDYSIAPTAATAAASFSGQILVPYPVQSALSGVKRTLSPTERLTYRRTFEIPAGWQGQRVLLQFGAVDWRAEVTVNGTRVGEHEGGYDAFSFDITDALKPEGEQEIIVTVTDPTDTAPIPRGKQVLEPKGIWYTAVSGIWQTVWLEPVPQAYISGLKITPDVDGGELRVEIASGGGAAGAGGLVVEALDGGRAVARVVSDGPSEFILKIGDAKLWSPSNPFLYDLEITLGDDTVKSYAGMRKIELKKDTAGLNRLFLNNEPLFQYGTLDQGWWPDGLYTAPTDEALRFDIEETRAMGFNMIRKHVKVEPARWYYWADKLGMLVWQDMPSGDKYIKPEEADIVRTPESVAIFENEYKALISGLYNHPSIVMWVPFNEGWGQFDTARIVEFTRQLDPTRLVNNTSGWSDRGVGDVNDMHKYTGPDMPEPEEKRAVVLGEFGGLGLVVPGHLWEIGRRWGYRDMKDVAELTDRYEALIEALRPMIARGLAAAIYTQTTDVEGEVNGLLTYDRAVNKMGAEKLADLHRGLYTIQSDPTVPKPTPPPMPERSEKK